MGMEALRSRDEGRGKEKYDGTPLSRSEWREEKDSD
jgi:hypothetical protein